MTASLTLTAAGIAAIADGANVGIAAVTFTRLALGSGTGMGDQSARAALETQKDIVAVTGSASTPGRVAIRGDYAPSEAYAVTEVGLFARVGAGGAEFLCAYWIAESDAEAVAAAAADTALVIAGIVEVVSAGADIDIAPAVDIQIGAPANVVYQNQRATVDQRGIVELATAIEAGAGADNERAITALVLAGILADYGTRTWVSAEIAKIVGSAPENLNTLQEIAAWLGSDADLSAAINNAIAGRVRRSGDTMAGALNLVTPAADDNSKKAVNSEWVRKNAGGVGNLAFFSRTTDFPGQGSFATAFSGAYTPRAATKRIGIFLNCRFEGQFQITRDGTPIMEPIDVRGNSDGWIQQLFVDAPATAAETTYTVQVARSADGTSGKVFAYSSMQVVELPDDAEVGILTNDMTLGVNNGWTDLAEVTITPRTAASRIALQMFALTSSAITVRLLRGSDAVVEVPIGSVRTQSTQIGPGQFPLGFEHWIDTPGVAAPVTYKLQVMTGSSFSIYAGSFLIARPAG